MRCPAGFGKRFAGQTWRLCRVVFDPLPLDVRYEVYLRERARSRAGSEDVQAEESTELLFTAGLNWRIECGKNSYACG